MIANIPTLIDKDIHHSTPTDKASLLCEYLASLPHAPTSTDTNLPDLHQVTHSSLSKITVAIRDVLRILLRLNTSKAIGPDQISNTFLKETAHQIAPSLTSIINMSLNQSKFTSQWKEATITPIYKKGDKGIKSNYHDYRPVSILSNITNIMERYVYLKLYNHYADKGLLTWRHSGFKARYSTVNHFIFLMDKVHRAIDKGNDVAIVYLGQSRAFDRIWHMGLIHKLQHMGIAGERLWWIQD